MKYFYIAPVLAAVIVGSLFIGGFGNSDRYFAVTVANATRDRLALYQCVDAACKSFDLPPEILKPGQKVQESGSSTAHQQFLAVHRYPRASICVDLFFKKRPTRRVEITFVRSALRAANARSCTP
jgi:hypothetical protein